MTYSDCEKEFKLFCGEGKTMTGQEIIDWVFSRMNVPHTKIAFLADKIREKYIDVKYPLGRKVYYTLRFWTDDKSGDLGYDFGYGKEYVQCRRDNGLSPRRYKK